MHKSLLKVKHLLVLVLSACFLYNFVIKQPLNYDDNPLTLILVGDIGGTNIRLQLVQIQKQSETILKKQILKSYKYPSLQSAIEQFLLGEAIPSVACMAIAGPVKDNRLKMANAQHWGQLDGSMLSQQLGIPVFKFINDFQAAAYGINSIQSKHLNHLNKVQPKSDLMKIVIGPGTGLGTAMIIPLKQGVKVVSTEAGHTNFAPTNQLQQQFYAFMQHKLKVDHLVSEKMFCGPSIPYLVQFVSQKYQISSARDEIDQIEWGILYQNSLERKALELLVDMYGDYIGDMITSSLPYGGVYLVGTLTNKFLPLITYDKLLARYIGNRPYMKHILDEIPVIVVDDVDLGILGALKHGRGLK